MSDFSYKSKRLSFPVNTPIANVDTDVNAELLTLGKTAEIIAVTDTHITGGGAPDWLVTIFYQENLF